jgi:peptidyl-prolyl cis-trans isomerase B (cyclophilin B)
MRRAALAICLGLVLSAGVVRAQDDKPPTPGPTPPPAPTYTLDDVKREYAEFEASASEYHAYVNAVSLEVKELIAFQGRVQEAREAAMKAPNDAELKKHADELEAEFMRQVKKHQEKRPEYQKRQEAYVKGLTGILKKLVELEEHTHALDVKIYRLRFLADQGAWMDIHDEVWKQFERNPGQKDLQILAGCLCLVVPPDRNHPQPSAPRFEKAYELLAPLSKERPEDQALRLFAGVAASALDKNAEAKVALDGVASLDSMRPALRILIYPNDPDGALKTWRDTAGTLAEKPTDADARKKRAELLLRCGANSLAARDAEAASKAKPDDRDVKVLQGRALYSGNEFERAVPVLREAVAAVESDDVVRAELAIALWNANDPAAAKAELAKIKTKDKLHPGLQQGLMNVQGSSLEEPWQAELKAREEDKKRDDNPRVLLETEKGKILIELFEDTAPNTVANFVYLAGNKFYDGVKFHRIIAGFMAQGGDPMGTGGGGPGWNIKDEVAKNPRLHWRGTISMAKTEAPNTGGSQFFLNHVPTPHLNGRHTVFGRVIEGQDVVDRLQVRDAIVHASVVRKRDHEYKPEQLEQFGHSPWKPGEPREGDLPPEKPGETKKADK